MREEASRLRVAPHAVVGLDERDPELLAHVGELVAGGFGPLLLLLLLAPRWRGLLRGGVALEGCVGR